MSRESIYNRYIPAVIPDPENDNCAYWFVFNQNKLLVTDNEIKIPCTKNIEEFDIFPIRTQYLGTLDGHPCYSAEVNFDTDELKKMDFRELRSLYGVLDEDVFLLAGKAFQIVNWDQTHQYCGRCGFQTEALQGENAKICPECGFISYTRISPAIITAVLKDDKILLARGSNFPENWYSIIAGFVEPGETLEECVKREVAEEVGLKVKNIRYFGSQPWPFPHSLMIGFISEYESGEICVDNYEITDAKWFSIDNLPELPSKMSISREIIDWYIKSMKSKQL
ncbi:MULTISPECIES: NAD(+) diphosphatase [Methanobacterium]|jgi:NAD+ diphosphatase|uniref:NAD(+) diphosphatase n=1 Tax=Methanobacterium veterum TaxID=408577 RepID=A0A9E5A0C8_9EURY|nr:MULTISPECIES: NAD(+) diphosphatase [Methanobacterium]MCZ3364524.1 NAD(+) diphosphatase [Methanobacterium veterum]MCZ3372277.1 NAD(+) diphosphatase [Methanobacterium veterum]